MGVRRVEELMVALWIEATLRRSKTVDVRGSFRARDEDVTYLNMRCSNWIDCC